MNTTMQPPRFEELNVLDDFMFNELTMQADEEKSILFCKILLETILGTPVRSLKIIPQKAVQGFSEGHEKKLRGGTYSSLRGWVRHTDPKYPWKERYP